MEQELTEAEAIMFVQEAVHDPKNQKLREELIDPIIEILEKPSGRKQYIEYGSSFLGENATMLAKEYPTKAVTFPRKYVDGLFAMFNFTMKSFKQVLKDVLKSVSSSTEFATITSSPTNVIHTVALYYSDMIGNRLLRDSARQQLGLSVYAVIFNKYYKTGLNESVMTYTYMQLDNSWGIVKAENIINWISTTVETAYGFYRTKLSLNMSASILVAFLNRLRNSMNQNMRGLGNKYYDNLENGNLIGADITGDEDHVVTNNYTVLKDNLLRLIKNRDELYYTQGKLYPAIAKLKNVKMESLFEYSTTKIKYEDIGRIIDNIFYVFLVKDGHSVDEINSATYIGRITNFPTAVDRAIAGKPIILPYSKKYKVDDTIVKAHICLVATYILNRINDVK
ncbi:MAG: hypothetical protein IKU29_00385 [Parabacteroides sp.]|nr:hypothetical protein [Parabacteroides sp.]